MQERLAALALLVASGAYLVLSLPLPRGAAARPGPGFFPLLVGVFLCAVALAFVAAAFRRAGAIPARARATAEGAPAAAGAGGRVAATAGALVGFCALLPWAGFPVITFLFVAALLRRLGGGGWKTPLAIGALSAAAAYYLFAVLLGVPLPRGLWLD